MPNVTANGIRIEYDTFGNAGAKPLLLVMGLGAQMISWDEAFCQQLVSRGHYVIRYDNRDVGLSQYFDEAGVPDMVELIQKFQAGEETSSPYSLDDMGADGIGLLDILGIQRAHICGSSMGGMIVQAMAINHPERVRTMTSIMSSTGNPELPAAKPEAMAVLTGPPPATREEVIEAAVPMAKVMSGGGFEVDEEVALKRYLAPYDRAFHPQGTARQLAAATSHGSRVAALKKIDIPTLVIHGTTDPLVPVEGGKDTAASVPGAELVLIEGMGHEMPVGAWPQIIEPLCALTEQAN